MRAGLDIARDLSEGKSLIKSVKSRGIEAAKRAAKRTLEGYQKGGGKRIKLQQQKKRVTKRPTNVAKTSPKSDIFGTYRRK